MVPLEWLFKNFRNCGICRLKCDTETMFCEACTELILEEILQEQPTEGWRFGYRHRWLLNWRDNPKFLSEFVHSLKGGGHRQTFLNLAQMFVAFRLSQFPRDGVLVYPSKGPEDHASAWARALGQILGYPTSPLLLVDPQKQARLTRPQRFNRRFSASLAGKSVILVDDILTTGATAKAAFVALNRPENFTIWTLFYRPLLSPSGSFGMVQK